MSDLSREKLIEFLAWTAEKGLLKRSTARVLTSACKTVLSVLNEDEARDVSKMDLTTVVEQYQNLHGMGVSPNTMQAYDRRVRQAVKEFMRYNEDRAGWKPSGVQRSSSQAQSPSKRRPTSRSSSKAGVTEPASLANGFDASEITHQFPLRRDMVVTVSGIPFDVKRSEMSRLTAFLSNLVATSDEEEEKQLMLTSPTSEMSE